MVPFLSEKPILVHNFNKNENNLRFGRSSNQHRFLVCSQSLIGVINNTQKGIDGFS
jgi:hypothetical protein